MEEPLLRQLNTEDYMDRLCAPQQSPLAELCGYERQVATARWRSFAFVTANAGLCVCAICGIVRQSQPAPSVQATRIAYQRERRCFASNFVAAGSGYRIPSAH